ncbi:MAG: response regulator [Deltaproteobacteria bacterium]|nr:response regulator [Deltaproteobacteria bacterium]
MRAKYCILIADDDHDLVRTLTDRLIYEGFDTLAAHEGVRVVEQAHRARPDLIILDLQMPAGTGQTVLERLQARPDTAKIPVIVLTGVGGPELEGEIRARGAREYLQKPYEPEDLLRKIRALLTQ